MCGICGHLDYHARGVLDPDTLRQGVQRLYARGPDDDGYHEEAVLQMGMRRLSLIDIEGGAQPIYNEDNSIAVMQNGEIYNFEELRRELEEKGHRFRTRSDTETIVHGYEEWGREVFSKFNGMFAAVVWDFRSPGKRRLLLARDGMGQKPLYWMFGRCGLSWASEISALRAFPWGPSEINPEALYHYLSLQFVPDPLSIYRDVSELPAGHCLEWQEGSENPQLHRWWRLSFSPKHESDADEASRKALEKLRQAVRRCMIADRPLGVFLSGGLDSTLLTALAAQKTTKPLKTFSIGFSEPAFSEAPFARRAAEHFGTEHHEFTFEHSQAALVLESCTRYLDEPLADPAMLPLYELARQARPQIVAALTGDGGDETMAGYQRYYLDAYFSWYAKLPDCITQKLLPALLDWIPSNDKLPEEKNVLLGLKRLKQFAATPPEASLLRWGSYFSAEAKKQLLSEASRYTGVPETDALFRRCYYEVLGLTHLDRTLAVDHQLYLAGNLLPKTDRMTMAHSLEARAPFLDAEWVRWSAQLPDSLRRRGREGKWLLRYAARELLPSDLLARPKQGFSLPIAAWLRGPLLPWCREVLLSGSNADPWFEREIVEGMLRAHEAGEANHGKRLWALLVFTLWYSHQR